MIILMYISLYPNDYGRPTNKRRWNIAHNKEHNKVTDRITNHKKL